MYPNRPLTKGKCQTCSVTEECTEAWKPLNALCL